MTNLELKSWRERMGFTQRKAAEELGITQSAYAALEKGRAYDTGKVLRIDRRTELACAALAQGLGGQSEEELYGDLGGREPDEE
jgi:transcriptional regulator with XRE-family HTH domain